MLFNFRSSLLALASMAVMSSLCVEARPAPSFGPGQRRVCTSDGDTPAQHLDVFLKQTSTSPVKLTVTVTNNYNETLTIDTRNSPLDRNALGKKILRVKEVFYLVDVDLPLPRNRPMYPTTCITTPTMDPGTLIELPPGAEARQDFEIDIPKHKGRGVMFLKSTAEMVGMWHDVWNMTMDEVIKLPKPQENGDMCTRFTSNLVKI